MGKRLGKHRWSATTSKTLEGSFAFTVSVVAFAWALRLCGVVESFSVRASISRLLDHSLMNVQTVRYTLIVVLSSVLEALSDQNDNLTLPLFMWSLLTIADV